MPTSFVCLSTFWMWRASQSTTVKRRLDTDEKCICVASYLSQCLGHDWIKAFTWRLCIFRIFIMGRTFLCEHSTFATWIASEWTNNFSVFINHNAAMTLGVSTALNTRQRRRWRRRQSPKQKKKKYKKICINMENRENAKFSLLFHAISRPCTRQLIPISHEKYLQSMFTFLIVNCCMEFLLTL